MNVEPLAAESLGVRSFAVKIAVDDTEVLIDPGTGLSWRPGMPPHGLEYQALQAAANRIDEAAENADAVVITHYHHDHFVPLEDDPDYEGKWSTAERSRRIYRGARVFPKDLATDINDHQSERGSDVRNVFDGVAESLKWADGATDEIGPITLRFSPAVPHGRSGTRFGWVVMVALEGPSETVVYTSDVGGPIESESTTWIEDREPDLVLVDGPSVYSRGISSADVADAQANLCRLARTADLIVDHHPIRGGYPNAFLEPVEAAAADAGHTIDTAASYRGDPFRPLEAWRDVLHEDMPVDPTFYDRVEAGEFADEPIEEEDMFGRSGARTA